MFKRAASVIPRLSIVLQQEETKEQGSAGREISQGSRKKACGAWGKITWAESAGMGCGAKASAWEASHASIGCSTKVEAGRLGRKACGHQGAMRSKEGSRRGSLESTLAWFGSELERELEFKNHISKSPNRSLLVFMKLHMFSFLIEESE